MSALDNLVTNRKQSQVHLAQTLNGTKWANMFLPERLEYSQGRGAYRHTDANRVGEACAEIYAIAQTYGYDIPGYVALKTDWTALDRPTPAQMAQYIATVAAIKSAFNASQTIPPTMRFITYEDANNIEKLLAEVSDIMERMLSIFVRCAMWNSAGVFYIVEDTGDEPPEGYAYLSDENNYMLTDEWGLYLTDVEET